MQPHTEADKRPPRNEESATAGDKTPAKNKILYLPYEDGLILWNLYISGFTPLQLVKTGVLPERLRNLAPSVVNETLERVRKKLALELDPTDERLKLIEHVRLMTSSWTAKLQSSQALVDSFDQAIARVLKNHAIDVNRDPGIDNLTETGFKLYQKALELRAKEIANQVKISQEIRNFDLQLADLTGAKKAAPKDDQDSDDPIAEFKKVDRKKLREWAAGNSGNEQGGEQAEYIDSGDTAETEGPAEEPTPDIE